MSIVRRVAVAAGLVLGPVAVAEAAIIDLFSYGTGIAPEGHQWQLELTVDEIADTATFTFSKTRGGGGYGLTDIYFEEGLGDLLITTATSPTLTTVTAGNQAQLAFTSVSITEPDEPALVPGLSNPWGDGVGLTNSLARFTFTGDFDNSLDRATDQNRTELVEITWGYTGSESALLAALLDGTGSSRIAVRVSQQNGNGTCGPGASCGLSSVNPVPIPPALWLLGSSLVGLVTVSRRRQRPRP
jgi:hypothetical protein